MDHVASSLASVKDFRLGGGDSFSDRLSCRYTAVIMVLFALMVTTKHYMGDPISCWCPSHLTDAQVDYTNRVCWVTNNYYLPFDSRIPDPEEPRELIPYYQWVGLILISQSLVFFIPRPIWGFLNKTSGIAVNTITDAAIECQGKMNPGARSEVMRYMVNHMTRFLREAHLDDKGCCKKFFDVARSWYLVLLYLFIKLLYLGNVVGQIFFMNKFLNTEYHLYGIDVLRNIGKGDSWATSERFPRVTLCDFKIRVVGNVQNYTVQCALPVNLLNEMIYTFLWFWFVFVAICTSASFIIWFVKIVFLPGVDKYITVRLLASVECIEIDEKLTRQERAMIGKFVRHYLRRDGLFMVWMVAKNTSDVVASELIFGVWKKYHGEKPKCLREYRGPEDYVRMSSEVSKIVKADRLDVVDHEDQETLLRRKPRKDKHRFGSHNKNNSGSSHSNQSSISDEKYTPESERKLPSAPSDELYHDAGDESVV